MRFQSTAGVIMSADFATKVCLPLGISFAARVGPAANRPIVANAIDTVRNLAILNPPLAWRSSPCPKHPAYAPDRF